MSIITPKYSKRFLPDFKKCKFLRAGFYYKMLSFVSVIKDGVPTSDDLQHLSLKLGTSWKPLARCLKFDKASITAFHKENEEFTEKALSMLQKWKAKYGSEATFRVLHDALCDELVCQRELAEQFCYC